MRIGIDFDNTIVSYDALFHQIALEKNLISLNLPVSKLAVRDHLRAEDKEDLWTLMQGEVYGSRMGAAIAYPSFFNFAKKAQEFGHKLFIISHKTKKPFAGPSYDLHKSAKDWIKNNMASNGVQLNENTEAFFEITKEDKISRIFQLNCDVFIDDLPEILAMPGFPSKTHKILFDFDKTHSSYHAQFTSASSWKQIQDLIIK
jgi:hypothetical protein